MSTFSLLVLGGLRRFAPARFGVLVTVLFGVCALLSYRHLGNIYVQVPIDTHLDRAWRERIHLPKEEFVATAISYAVGDDYDYSHIKAMCDTQLWDSSLVFDCRGIIGGIGNIRQELLHCIRYAIDAGAGLIDPITHLRSGRELSKLENGTATMDYLFDQARFLSRINTACPQMLLYKGLEELEEVGVVRETEIISLNKLPHLPLSRVYSVRSRVKELKAPAGQVSLIPFERVWQYYPICHDPVGFANAFGSLIPLRPDVHYLASSILYEMSSRYYLPIDPSVTTTLRGAHTFLGIHLRTANDILPYWLGYADQATYYLSRIKSSDFLHSLPIIYVASGNATSVHEFSAEAKSLSPPKTVVTKHDLLSGAELAELNSLTWDQQALVDLLVLRKSGYFIGMADSSFAWTIAVERRKTSRAGSCGFRTGFWKSHLLGTAFRDEFSDLLGKHYFYWESNMWP